MKLISLIFAFILCVTECSAAVALPLKTVSGQRYLVDQNNQPFYFVGDAPQYALLQVSTNDLETYLNDRQARGFNSVWVVMFDKTYQSSAPQNYYGEVPFDGADFTSMDTAYWSRVDFQLNMISAHGMIAIANPGFVGSDYQSSFLSSSTATLNAFGAWLGNRYKNYTNIIWLIGGDADPTVSGLYSKLQDMTVGIRSNAPNQLITLEAWGASVGRISSMDACMTAFGSIPSWLDINWIYPQSITNAYTQSSTNYWRSGALPALMGEDLYELENSTTPLSLRKESYWESLGGCNLGRIFGNGAIWPMGGPSNETGFTWQSQTNSPGSIAEQMAGYLFQSRAFQLLVPDLHNTVLTAGYQSGDTLAVAAATSDKHTVIAYIPTQRAVTVAMANLSGSTANAWWYNPTNGIATSIGSYATTGTQSFTPPDTNDWVLVLDDASQNYPAPGTSAPQGPVISVNLTNQTASVGFTVALGIVADGSAPLGFQWFFGGAPLPGATSNPLVLSNVTLVNAGSYQVVVTNSVGAAASYIATLSVLTTNALAIQAAPGNLFQISFSGIPGRTYTLEYTTNLASSWQNMGSAMMNSSGTFNFYAAPASASGFFRSSYP